MRATKWARDTSNTSGSWEVVLYLKFPPQHSFYTLIDYGSKFLPKPIFPFKNSWLSLEENLNQTST